MISATVVFITIFVSMIILIMTKNYEQVRFFLFTSSYSGERIRTYLKGKFRDKKLTKVIKNLSAVLHFKNAQVSKYVLYDIKPASPYRRLPYPLKIYLEIENELSKLSEEKLDEYSTALEDYQKQLLCPAIERAVGNFLEDVEDDNKFQKLLEEKFKPAHYTYYKVAYKYKLPTLRLVPFILRLICD